MTFPNFFCSDHSTIRYILDAGLHIDSIENHCTEEKRIAYNSRNPEIPLIEKCVREPIALAYYVSKPGDDESPY